MGRWPSAGRLHEAFDEGQSGVRDFAPATVDGQGVSAVLDLDDLGDVLVVLLLLVGGMRDRPGAVLFFSPEMISSGLPVSATDLGSSCVSIAFHTGVSRCGRSSGSNSRSSCGAGR